MKRLAFGLVLAASLSAAADTAPQVFAKPPSDSALPLLGRYVGKDRAKGTPCDMTILSATRTKASPIKGVDSIFHMWNLETTITAKMSAWPGKVFKLKSAPEKRWGGTYYSWMRAEVNEGLFGIRGTVMITYTNGKAYGWSYSPNKKREIDSGPECNSMVWQGK